MGIEENNSQIMHKYFEAVNNHDGKFLADTISMDYIFHGPAGEVYDIQEYRELSMSLAIAFPDVHYILETMVAQGDFVFIRTKATATHKGEFMGIQPTGKKHSYEEAILCRFSDGKIVEEWSYMVVPTLFQQLGVTPTN